MKKNTFADFFAENSIVAPSKINICALFLFQMFQMFQMFQSTFFLLYFISIFSKERI